MSTTKASTASSQIKPYHYSSYQPLYQTSGSQLSNSSSNNNNNNNCKCTKFLPQLFNANKCQQCFNVKELHSLEALAEFSKSNRKVCKYSYLFIAPPDLELNKTKRWQWRFFIFHDDGELTYSLDENPLTLPQGRINMKKCEEIMELVGKSSFEDVTKTYPNSLRLRFAAPNKDIYIAAGNYEEISKWRDVLSLYCKRTVHKTESSPIKVIHQSSDKTTTATTKTSYSALNKVAGQQQQQQHLDEFEHIENIDDIDDIDDIDALDADDLEEDLEDIDEQPLDKNNDFYDEDYEDDEYEFDELATVKRQQNDNFYYKYTSKNQSLSSSSSSSSSSNTTRKENNNLKMKMVSGLQKSVSKSKLAQESSSARANLAQENNNRNDNDNDSKTNSESNSNDTSISNEPKDIQNDGNVSSAASSNGQRRLSYKEDDLVRKQRLKDNLNQLLIEYKHEEEQQLKKSSKFNSLNGASGNGTGKHGQRMSLDSCYNSAANKFSGYNKSSAFSLVVPPNQLQQQQQPINSNSAFKPINSSNVLAKNADNSHLPIKIQANKSKLNTQQQQQQQPKPTSNQQDPTKVSAIETSSSSSSQSSWTSTSSSSSSSSSKSPPKTRAATATPTNNTAHQQSSSAPAASLPEPSTTPLDLIPPAQQSQAYKKPCLISPRKATATTTTTSSSSSSSASDNNSDKEIIITKETSPSPKLSQRSLQHRPKNSFGVLGSNTSGYLWKLCEPSSNLSQLKLAQSYYTTAKDIEHGGNKFEKFWFSLNTSLCCLIYWNDKYEQDLGKFPLGKYELAKCCQIGKETEDALDFKLLFHQGAGSITLKATSVEKRHIWIETLKQTIESLSSICSKCKPKLIVNPMPLATPAQSNDNSRQQQQSVLSPQQQQGNSKLNGSLAGSSSSSEYFQLKEQMKEANYLKQQQQQIKQSNKASFQQSLPKKSSHQFSKVPQQQQVTDDPTESSSISSSPSILNSTCSHSNPNTSPNNTSSDATSLIELDQMRQKNEKLQREANESNRKFKLLEQIHLDAVNEFDKQQSLMYSQLEELTIKLNQSEFNQEGLNNKMKEKQEASVEQIRTLKDEISEYKEKCKHQDQVIEALNKRIEVFNASFAQITGETCTETPGGWNKEVKHLDARITDVLGKLREREMNLHSPSNNQDNLEVEKKMQGKLQEAQAKIVSLSSQLKQYQETARASLSRPALQDFSDDLAKVLMSKEEVITQLERQLKEKEKLLQTVGDQLNEEIRHGKTYQSALSSEQERNSVLSSDLKQQADELHHSYTEEVASLREQVEKLTAELESVQVKLAQALIENDTLGQEMKNAAEFNRNEMDTAQEEIKTLEYKLVHSQRQAQEYQSILEDLDLANTNTAGFLQQVNNSSSNAVVVSPLVNEAEGEIVNAGSSIQSKLKRNQWQVQLLTQQVCTRKSRDVERLEGELDKLRVELNEVKEENVELNDHIYSIDVFMREKDQQCDQYQKEKEDLERALESSNGTDSGCMLGKESIQQLRRSLGKLIKFVDSSDLMQFNSQIVSYMAEQLVHKSALNGNLKFACDVLKNKSQKQDGSQVNNSLHNQESKGESFLSANNVQDEKIFKLASELLLSDENSLRKLSAQVLNEAQHLTQLNCILNTLKKIRWKHLKLKVKDKVDGTLEELERLADGDEDEDDVSAAESEDGSDGDGEKLDYILGVVRDVFTQHKIQISEQLNEVQKIMSISSDDELLTHLQTENSMLQKELQKYQESLLSSDKKSANNSHWLAQKGNATLPLSSQPSVDPKKFNPCLTSSCDKHILTDTQTPEDTIC